MMTRKLFLQRLFGSVAGSAVFARFPLLAAATSDPGVGSGSKLMAGVAKKKITPSPDNLKDYAKANPSLNGEVAEEIYARIIVLGNQSGQKLLLLSADLLEVPHYNQLVEKISAKYGIAKTACILSGTRNHQAVALDSTKPIAARIATETMDNILAGVGEAIAAMQPAKMALAKGTSNINVHTGRMTPAGYSQTADFGKFADKELSVLRIDDLSGKTLALHVNYGMQSNMLEACSKKLSGDLAGNISGYIERRLGCMCAWSVGAAAEAYPLATGSVSSPIYGADGKLMIDRITLSEEITGKLRSYLTATQGLDIIKTYNKIGRFSETFAVRSGEQTYKVAGKKGPIVHRLHLAVVNEDIAFAGANSITSAGLGRIVKQALPYRTVFLSSEGESVGYVVDKETDPAGVAGMQSPVANAWESERIYVEGFTKLAKHNSVRA